VKTGRKRRLLKSISGLVRLRSRDRELQAKRVQYTDHRAKLRVALGTESFVKAFAGQSCFLGNLRHAAGAADGAERLGDKSRIIGFQGSSM
jgi:hypothetical protein